LIPIIVDLTKTVIKSPYVQINRFSSFAPVKKNNKVKLYIDGKDYFADLYTAHSNAKDTIFITDW
jgi:phospholipase D1/2